VSGLHANLAFSSCACVRDGKIPIPTFVIKCYFLPTVFNSLSRIVYKFREKTSGVGRWIISRLVRDTQQQPKKSLFSLSSDAKDMRKSATDGGATERKRKNFRRHFFISIRSMTEEISLSSRCRCSSRLRMRKLPFEWESLFFSKKKRNFLM
jgi:hypothetical protein